MTQRDPKVIDYKDIVHSQGSMPLQVTLVNMPWGSVHRPAIAIGILSQLCKEASVAVSSLYPNFDMAANIGLDVAKLFADEVSLYGVSEHLFAVDLFGKESLESDDYLRVFCHILREDELHEDWSEHVANFKFLSYLRDEVVPQFLDKTTARVLAENPTVVGFTATFNQSMASLALASRLKKVNPNIQCIAGGACFDDEMGEEFQRAFPHIFDHIFLGEAENSFRTYLRHLKDGKPAYGIPGVTSFKNGMLESLPSEPLRDMNLSPRPDYESYFREKSRIDSRNGKEIYVDFLPYESSRGCWWGYKQHCIFCGINPDIMDFRSKDVDRVIDEIVEMSSEYGVVKFMATDWILSRSNANKLFERLKALNIDLDLFYEVRANLQKSKMKLMKEAGVNTIQPGIESFSTPLLEHMKKWTSGIRQVQFIRWCREYDILPRYNILYGFPGERAEWYLEMAKRIPDYRHLPPPMSNVHPVEMHRFAPLFRDRESFGVIDYDLRSDYRHNFPKGLIDSRKIGYFFDYSSSEILEGEDHLIELRGAIAEWCRAYMEAPVPIYEYVVGPTFVRVVDTRDGRRVEFVFRHLEMAIILLCDQIRTRETLAKDLISLYPHQVSDGRLDKIVGDLVKQGILMAEGNKLLTIPVGQHPRTTEELRAMVLESKDPVLGGDSFLKGKMKYA